MKHKRCVTHTWCYANSVLETFDASILYSHIQGFQGLQVFWFHLHVEAQFAFSFVALAVCFAAPTPPSLLWLGKYLVLVSIWVGKYLHWFCQCYGAWWLPVSGLPWIPARSAQTLSQARLLVMSLTVWTGLNFCDRRGKKEHGFANS